MKCYSLRGVDDKLSRKLKEEAARYDVSINQYVLNVLQEATGLKKERHFTRTYDDLDHLFGTWQDDESARIEQKLADQRQIDEELWE